MTTKFFEFTQNNSGGYFDVDENVAHRVVIEAVDEMQANAIFVPMIENQSGSCPCCGDRWYGCNEIDLSKYAENGHPAKIYTHYKDYEKRWQDLYGGFDRKQEPGLSKQYSIEHFGTNVFFKNVEEYCQLMANGYGWTTPDIRIHYLDGTKKEIFKTKLKS